MPFNKIPAGTLLGIDGADYWPHGYINGRHQWVNVVTGEMYVCPAADGTVGLPTDADFSQLLASGRLVLKSALSNDRAKLLTEVSQMALDDAKSLDPAVEKRLEQVNMLDAAGVPNGDKAIERFLSKEWTAELIEKFGPHDPPRTIRRWRSARGRPGFRRAGEMVSMRGRAQRMSRSNDVPSEVEWKHALAGQRDRAKPADTYTAYRAEIVSINEGRHPTYPKPETPYPFVSKRTIRRRIYALECAATTETKKGEAAVQQDWSGGGKPLTADFAMQYVIIDHTRLDVFAVDDEQEMVLGRAWLTLAVDVRTRAIVAHLISFVDPSIWTVGEILRRMVLPKRPPTEFAERYPILVDLRGKPFEIIVDNAVEFRSHSFEAAARGAGFGVRFCPIKRPRYRAIGERTIGTIKRKICDNLPGRVLQPEEARRLGHDSEDDACMLMIEIEAVANFAIAQYNTSPHSELNERQPALVFEQDANKNGINNFADFEAFRIDTMKIVTGAQLTPAGINTFECLRHADVRGVPELLDDLVSMEARRKRRDDATATVDYRYDPADIRYIYVWNRRTHKHVRLTCTDERYSDGMPEWFHDRIREHAEKQGLAFNTEAEREAAQSRLIDAIKQINPAESARARKAVAKLYEIPRLRQITGNIVHLHTAPSQVVTLTEFLANDRAAETALDLEILSPRPEPRKKASHQNLRDRRDAGQRRKDGGQGTSAGTNKPATSPSKRRRIIKGEAA